ncbi:MAG: hypothetical protein SGILL_004518, partial [Bacillariaceae sp.]
VEALTNNGNAPSSPLRKDAQCIDAQEEKKESEDAATATSVPTAAAPTSGTGVDVVSKILANFDDICAVPKDAKHPQQSSSITSSKNGKKDEFSHPEWGREPSMDGDETTTNPSLSLPSESSDPYSSAYTNSTSMMMGPDRRGVIKKSPSQDHENFEVVLDPTTLLSDDDKDEPAAPKQRRWPFSNSISSKKTASEPKKAPAVPPPIKEEDIKEEDIKEEEIKEKDIKEEEIKEEDTSEETPDPLIPAVSLPVSSEEGVVVENVKKDDNDGVAKKDVAKKSLVKRSWKSCKKLIAKASGAGKEPKQEHFAEVDNEAQNTETLVEQQESPVESGLDQPFHNENEGLVQETPEDEKPDDARQDIPGSTTTVWNSFVASIAGTFDPEIAAATTAPQESTEDEVSPVEEEKLPNEDTLEATSEPQDELPVEVTAGPERKEKTKLRASIGWKSLRSIKRNAKSLVNAPKKESASDPVPDATSMKPQAQVETDAAAAPPTDASQAPLRKPKAVWKAVEDQNSGKTYYYHRKTRETTWSKPQEYQQYEVDLQKWKAAQTVQEESMNARGAIPLSSEKSPATAEPVSEDKSADRPNSPRVASWPSSAPKSETEEKKEVANMRRTVTPPARTAEPEKGNLASTTASSLQPKNVISSSTAAIDKKENSNCERRKEVERLLGSLRPDNARKSVNQLMKEYSGREDVLVKELRAKVESQPPEETRPFDEPVNMEARKRSAAPRSPHRFGQRTMTYMSKASATTRSSALTDRTEKIKNTGKGKLSPFVPINETLSSATSISSHNEDDKFLSSMGASPARRVPSRVPVPRERQLMVEELTDSRISAESYEGNGGKRGRIVRGRAREPVQTHLDTVYDGDNDDNTDDDNTASLYDNDTYGTDSVSALSENDTDFIQRKDNFEQARRRALDDAIEREDWDLAAALSEGMRAANMPGGYERAHTSWNQSELDKFIANNDWSAVKNYIARMREKSQTSANKSIGARSQLQHKELMSESSWTSDSQSSYESYDSESEI